MTFEFIISVAVWIIFVLGMLAAAGITYAGYKDFQEWKEEIKNNNKAND